jgi:hypothetical protein
MKTDLARCALLLGGACLLAACSSSPIPPVRFANAPAVFVVDDRRDVPVPPREREYLRDAYHLDTSIFRPVDRAMAMPAPRRALGVNALDEVPDSTWFTNRVGVRDMTPEEIRTGPMIIGTPEQHKPWTVTRTKKGGRSPGIMIKDARGERFILKFDPAGVPEMETAADVIVARLLWAAGYNVPEDHVVHLKRSDLVIAKDAIVDDDGKKRPLDAAALDAILAQVHVESDGTIRGLVSPFIDGKIIGGHPAEGVRRDDPNDRIPHEMRRDLRGTQAFFAWLDHNDMREDSTVDTWIADPADKRRHYVKHFFVDFGKALGVMAFSKGNPRLGYDYRYSPSNALTSLVSAGLYERNWERRRGPNLRGVGLYDVKTYDPGHWKAATPAYTPLITADRFDKYWASKIMMRFTRSHLLAAVEAGRLTDSTSVEYLVDTLEQRQRETAGYWFRRVSPLDDFTVENGSLCFTDLMLHHKLAPASTRTEYRMQSFDRDGKRVDPMRAFEASNGIGRICTPLVLPRDGDGYSVVRLETRRTDDKPLVVYVHAARAAAGGPEVIGIWRQ